MKIYKNSYTKDEDYMLWELHEIRHKLHESRKTKTIDQINEEALKNIANWQEEDKRRKLKSA
jgi:hypothetical protein